jgi:predicted amidohydrolase YtcJ
VFEQDLFSIPPDEWLGVEVEMTLVNGEIVYRKGRD